MVSLISATDLEAITTVAHGRTWAGLSDEAWQAVNTCLGGVTSLRILAFIPASALRAAIRAARVPTPAVGDPADANHIPAGLRELSAVEGTQVGLLTQIAQLKLGKAPTDPLVEPPTVGGPPGGPPPVAPNVGNTGTSSSARKVKNSQVLDQADEGEIPELTQGTVEDHFKVPRKVKGGPVRPEAEPSPDQISAMKVRVLDLGLAPYADFAIFVNFQGRFSKTLKFLNHILQPDGTFRAVEVAGPPSYDAWLASWRVYENTLLTLEHQVGPDRIAVVSVSALEEYKDAFRDLAVLYPESWHLLVVAEDRCRGEHFTRLKREPKLKHTKGLSFEFDPDQPWDGVFRAAARDREYWDKSVREPALLFRTAGKGHKEQSGGTGSGTDQTGKVSPKKRPKKSQKDRLKAQLAKYRDTPGESGPVSKGQYPGQDSSHGKGKGRGPKRHRQTGETYLLRFQ